MIIDRPLFFQFLLFLTLGHGLSFADFPLEMVTIKLELAKNYLNVLEIVEPGLSKFRAKYMFELVDTKLFLFCEELKRKGRSNYDIQGIKNKTLNA